MNIEDFRNYCLSLPHVTEDLPFGPEALVFKVKGKMFALTHIENFESINLKCEPEKAVLLRESYQGVLPGYHMNKKHWNTILMDGSIPDDLIIEWTNESYKLVVNALPKSLRF
ncbi:MAG: MmcQ/YjbR family DNA-binding protein [Cytophagaceae bacterium]